MGYETWTAGRRVCSRCTGNVPMALENCHEGEGKRWHCPTPACQSTMSIRKDSFYTNSKLSLKDSIMVIYPINFHQFMKFFSSFTCVLTLLAIYSRLPLAFLSLGDIRVVVHRRRPSDTGPVDSCWCAAHSPDWFNMHRDLCIDWMNAHPIQIDGTGHVVQINESVISSAKRGANGQAHRHHQRWVFGA